MSASITTGRALQYVAGFRRGLLHQLLGHRSDAWMTTLQNLGCDRRQRQLKHMRVDVVFSKREG
ncbi:hypothetical protein, partial [Cereibacter changlensis]|uniref:hypothetical protein n=1 Tax=Cereibacter changlensis TaxID=402884 RepID=UPI001C63B1AD